MDKDAQVAPRLSADLIESIRKHVDVFEQADALWATRDDSKAQPEVREAANTAMDAIDSLIGELYGIRNRLVGEIRDSDDAANVRIDALLARSKATVTRVNALLAQSAARA